MRRALFAALTLSLCAPAAPAQSIPAPRAFLGFEVGADRTLADWKQITGYFAALAAASPAVTVDTLGPTTANQPLIVATISTPENIARLAAIRAAQARLADPRTLPAAEEQELLRTQPAVVLISCNIHATEIASSQMAMELAWRLATVDTLQQQLRDVVVLLIPSINPDGEQMITDWYRQNLGTRWEGGPLPWLYHPYVGHDNNRDWYMVTQRETRLATDFLYRRWFPHIVYDVHQMGSEGMRLFVPPMVDPVNPNLDPLIVRGIGLIGAQMAFALERRGKSGVGDGAIYDLWWHGGFRGTPTRHNMIGLLTEAASVRIATPITQDTSQLRGHARGLPRYQQQTNFPNPWPGGTWRLRDIVDYELIASEALVRLASTQREEFVRGFVEMGRRQVELGRTTSPRAFHIPDAQRDPGSLRTLIDVLQVGGVEVHHGPGGYWVLLDQPYRAHAKDLLEVQRFPKLEQYPGGPPERPYDVAGWTLPLQMGVTVRATDSVPAAGTLVRLAPPNERSDACLGLGTIGARSSPATYTLLDGRDIDDYRRLWRALEAGAPVATTTSAVVLPDHGTFAAGTYVLDPAAARVGLRCDPPPSRIVTRERPRATRPLGRGPRIALYKPWTANMDEGWTRWLFDQFDVPYVTLTDSLVRAGKLRDQFDVVLVSDMSLREARDGMSASAVPPQYAGGLGVQGIAEVKRFVEAGGTLVLLDHASEIGTEIGVPVTRITVPTRSESQSERAGAGSPEHREQDALYAPGSILRVLVDRTQPIAFGMPDTAAVYFTNSVSFEVPAGSPVRVVARYPARGAEILLSGFLQGADAIAGTAAAIDAPLGRGRVVMFGFRPQYRGQSYGTFRLVFNALLAGAEERR
jgi:zinc carboxypeptidase